MTMNPRRQLRWWREGGFRLPWLARLTRGRAGLGRWTQAEVDACTARARERYRHLFEEEVCPECGEPVTREQPCWIESETKQRHHDPCPIPPAGGDDHD